MSISPPSASRIDSSAYVAGTDSPGLATYKGALSISSYSSTSPYYHSHSHSTAHLHSRSRSSSSTTTAKSSPLPCSPLLDNSAFTTLDYFIPPTSPVAKQLQVPHQQSRPQRDWPSMQEGHSLSGHGTGIAARSPVSQSDTSSCYGNIGRAAMTMSVVSPVTVLVPRAHSHARAQPQSPCQDQGQQVFSHTVTPDMAQPMTDTPSHRAAVHYESPMYNFSRPVRSQPYAQVVCLDSPTPAPSSPSASRAACTPSSASQVGDTPFSESTPASDITNVSRAVLSAAVRMRISALFPTNVARLPAAPLETSQSSVPKLPEHNLSVKQPALAVPELGKGDLEVSLSEDGTATEHLTPDQIAPFHYPSPNVPSTPIPSDHQKLVDAIPVGLFGHSAQRTRRKASPDTDALGRGRPSPSPRPPARTTSLPNVSKEHLSATLPQSALLGSPRYSPDTESSGLSSGGPLTPRDTPPINLPAIGLPSSSSKGADPSLEQMAQQVWNIKDVKGDSETRGLGIDRIQQGAHGATYVQVPASTSAESSPPTNRDALWFASPPTFNLPELGPEDAEFSLGIPTVAVPTSTDAPTIEVGSLEFPVPIPTPAPRPIPLLLVTPQEEEEEFFSRLFRHREPREDEGVNWGTRRDTTASSRSDGDNETNRSSELVATAFILPTYTDTDDADAELEQQERHPLGNSTSSNSTQSTAFEYKRWLDPAPGSSTEELPKIQVEQMPKSVTDMRNFRLAADWALHEYEHGTPAPVSTPGATSRRSRSYTEPAQGDAYKGPPNSPHAKTSSQASSATTSSAVSASSSRTSLVHSSSSGSGRGHRHRTPSQRIRRKAIPPMEGNDHSTASSSSSSFEDPRQGRPLGIPLAPTVSASPGLITITRAMSHDIPIKHVIKGHHITHPTDMPDFDPDAQFSGYMTRSQAMAFAERKERDMAAAAAARKKKGAFGRLFK